MSPQLQSAQQELTSSQPQDQSISASAGIVPTAEIAVERLDNQPAEADMPISASDSAPPAERATDSDSLAATAEGAEPAALPDSPTKVDSAKSARETFSDLPVSTH